MKSFLLGLIAVVFTLGFGIPDAEAKRLGGGGSFGMQRQISPQQAPRAPSAAPQQGSQNANATPPKRSWLGPVAGLAAGLGLAALFSHLGLGEELASFVLIALLVFAGLMVFRMLTRRTAAAQPADRMQYAGQTAGAAIPGARAYESPLAGGGAPSRAPHFPRDFDVDAFTRQAKVQFIRLQAANDAGNLDDLREFLSPEVFAEVRLQLTERGASAQHTDIVELNADVLEVVEEAARYVVSVRFSGLLREAEGLAPTGFDEVWHLTKPKQGKAGWTVAGIQQVA